MLTHLLLIPYLGYCEVLVLTAMTILVFLFTCLGDNDVHVCDAQRHGHASLPVFAQDVYNLASPREE
jgi:hypothetical protein